MNDLWIKIITYIITTFLGIFIGFLIKAIKDYVQGEKTEKEALKCLLRSNIVTQYYIYRELGSIPFYVKESMYQEESAYKGLGGNSFILQLMKEVDTWKVQK